MALLATGSWPKTFSAPEADIFTARRPTGSYLVTCSQESHRLEMDEKATTRGDPIHIHPSIRPDHLNGKKRERGGGGGLNQGSPCTHHKTALGYGDGGAGHPRASQGPVSLNNRTNCISLARCVSLPCPFPVPLSLPRSLPRSSLSLQVE